MTLFKEWKACLLKPESPEAKSGQTHLQIQVLYCPTGTHKWLLGNVFIGTQWLNTIHSGILHVTHWRAPRHKADSSRWPRVNRNRDHPPAEKRNRVRFDLLFERRCSRSLFISALFGYSSQNRNVHWQTTRARSGAFLKITGQWETGAFRWTRWRHCRAVKPTPHLVWTREPNMHLWRDPMSLRRHNSTWTKGTNMQNAPVWLQVVSPNMQTSRAGSTRGTGSAHGVMPPAMQSRGPRCHLYMRWL